MFTQSDGAKAPVMREAGHNPGRKEMENNDRLKEDFI